MSAPQAVVVGAGVGGLAAGLALARAGWSVRVLERRADPNGSPKDGADAGAGISVWPNAGRALAALGVEQAALAGAALGGRSGVRAPSGRWVAHTDLTEAIRSRYGRPLLITRRSRLLSALTDALGADKIQWQALVAGAGSATDRAWVDVAGERRYTADLVVLADGARSRLRDAVVDADPGLRYAGYTSWRFIAPRPAGPIEPAETWGPGGQRFAVLPLDEQHVYCYATASAEARRGPTHRHPLIASRAEEDRHEDHHADLLRRFGTWHAPIPDLLAQLPPGAIIRTDVIEMAMPPVLLHRNRLVLVGDAAHAMTPDLGQGGCQALEDAVTLGVLTPAGDLAGLATGLARYSALRGPRGADLVRRSHRARRIYQSPLWLARAAARVGGLAPVGMLVRSLAPVLDWRPPDARKLQHRGRQP